MMQSSHSSTKTLEELRVFIKGFLKIAGVKEFSIQQFTDDESMLMFADAFTHWTYNLEHNYELYEFLGNGTIKDVVVHYIHERFPYIVNEGYMTKLQHYMESKRALGGISKTFGFDEFVKYGEDLHNAFKKYE